MMQITQDKLYYMLCRCPYNEAREIYSGSAMFISDPEISYIEQEQALAKVGWSLIDLDQHYFDNIHSIK